MLGKYTAKGLLVYNDVLAFIFYVIRNKFNKKFDKELNSILNSSEKWLKNLYMINEIFGEKKDIDENNTYELDMEFDFPSWLSRSHLPLDQFKKHSKYVFNNDFKKLNYLRSQIKSIYGKDNKRAFNRYLMQYVHKGADFLEKKFQKVF